MPASPPCPALLLFLFSPGAAVQAPQRGTFLVDSCLVRRSGGRVAQRNQLPDREALFAEGNASSICFPLGLADYARNTTLPSSESCPALLLHRHHAGRTAQMQHSPPQRPEGTFGGPIHPGLSSDLGFPSCGQAFAGADNSTSFSFSGSGRCRSFLRSARRLLASMSWLAVVMNGSRCRCTHE
jgi:hypothetical protein